MAQVIPLRGGYYSDFRFKGKRYKRFLSKDKREAAVELGKLIEKVRGERRSNKKDLPWATFKEVLLHGQAPHKRASTQVRDKASFALLDRELKPEYLSDITPKKLRDLITVRLRDGKKASSIKREMGSIKAMMRWAEQEGYRDPEDWRIAKVPRVPKTRPHYHTHEQMKVLLDHCHGMWKRIGWLGARAGLRRAEIKWLAKEDVKFDEDLIRIRGKEGWLPKDSDERDILLLPDLKKFLLVEWPKIKGPWVVSDAHGHRPDLGSMTTYFKRRTRAAGLRGGVQTLRHTYLTHLANDGVNIYALQEWAGHADVRTTMGYIHPAKSYKDELPKIKPLL